MSHFKVLFQLTGSIAAYKACQVVSRLVQAGAEVQVVCTPGALQFVGEATLEGLTGKSVKTQVYGSGEMMDHIQLARWADVAVLCPATANTINKLAHGVADDLVGSLYLAWERHKPYMIFPAMNSQMLEHPATQEALQKLRHRGARVFATARGTLACGENGEGKLLEPEEILEHILATQTPMNRGRILITSGGTREPIDGVRSITNTSSGTTGAFLADHFSARGWQVTLVHSEKAVLPQLPCELLPYDTFVDLERTLKRTLSQNSYEAAIHLAAVSDYSVSTIESGAKTWKAGESSKIDSGEELTLRLKRNAKLLPQLKSWSKSPDLFVVGFKLTNNATPAERQQAVDKLFAGGGINTVVHNDLSELGVEGAHPCEVIMNATARARCQTKQELAERLEYIFTHLPVMRRPVAQEVKNDPMS